MYYIYIKFKKIQNTKDAWEWQWLPQESDSFWGGSKDGFGQLGF